MAGTIARFVCDVCGAVLSIPADDAVLEVACAHCGHAQLVPDADRRRKALAERQERARQERERVALATSHDEAVRSSSRMSIWITLGFLVFGLVIATVTAGPSLVQTWTTLSPVLVHSPAPVPTAIPVVSPPTAPPAPIAVTPMPPTPSAAELADAARARVAALMRDRMQGGCRRVMMPPEIVTGPKGLTAELVRGRQCIEIFAIAGRGGGTVTVTMSSPFGEPVGAPSAGAEVQFRHCPTVAGPHPVRVTPSGNEPYAIAAIECPRR